jgi:hypothetical protein
VKVKRSRTHCAECPEQCFCGSTKQLEGNHFGGENQIPGIWLPFCGEDHKQFHVNCRRAGVDFSHTLDRSLGLIQALKAMLVGMWMVVEFLERHIKSQSEVQLDGTQKEECSTKDSAAYNSEHATSNRDAEQ